MITGGALVTYSDRAQELEIVRKRALLDELEETCASRETDLTTYRIDLEAFRSIYVRTLAPLYARLDEIEAEIKAYEFAFDPDNEDMRAEAESANARAKQSRDETGNTLDETPAQRFEPTVELKTAHRRAAKLVHPDHSKDVADRTRRNSYMARINAAYKKGDLLAIEVLIAEFMSGAEPDQHRTTAEVLEHLDRQITRVLQRIAAIESEFTALNQEDLAKMMRDVERQQARGKNAIKQAMEEIEKQIVDANSRLHAWREKLKFTQNLNSSGEPTATPLQSEDVRVETPLTSFAPNSEFRPSGLIHTTDRGEKVRSKSEVIIANLLNNLGIDYIYEYPLEGHNAIGIRRPDFMIEDYAGNKLLWEHLGLLHEPIYFDNWQKKLSWYNSNGYMLDENLFMTRDEPDGSLNSQELRLVAEKIVSLLTQNNS